MSDHARETLASGSPAPETPVAELIASACEAIRRLGTLRRDMGTVMGLIERRSRPSQDHLDQLQMLKKWRRDIDHVEAALTQAHPLPSQTQEVEKEVARLLRELYTLVKGECPSLLNEDSGGDARLALAIEAALLAAPARDQGWQPIASAPNGDETDRPVLVYARDNIDRMCFMVGMADLSTQGWRWFTATGNPFIEPLHTPTHWRALPTPPTQGGTEG